MGDLFTVENLLTLLMLTLLQAVLGFDNLLYISMESKRVEAGRRLSKPSNSMKKFRIGCARATVSWHAKRH